MIPLHKGKEDMKKVSSYRAIILTPSLSKTMGRFIVIQLRQYFEDNGVLTDNQHSIKRTRL